MTSLTPRATCPPPGVGCQTSSMSSARVSRSAWGPLGPRLITTFAFAIFATACEGSSPEEPGSGNPGLTPGQPSTVEPAELPSPHACGVRVRELAVFQAVKVPLVLEGQPVAPSSPLIEGRRGYFRAYISFDTTNLASAIGNARARLRLESQHGSWHVDGAGFLSRESTDAALESTFNFDVPGDYIRGDLRVGVELELGASCAGAKRLSFPTDGLLPLQLQNTGVMKVTLVPVAYDADTSGRLPDVSEAQLARYRDLLLAYYPTAAVDLGVRAPVRSSIALSSGGGWGQFLDSIRSLKQQDGAGADTHYYALVSPAATFQTYCSRSCIAGLSYLAARPSALQQVGAGVGFTGPVAADTLAHEIGHQHGRGHAPCGADAGLDRGYPHTGATLGAWGLDFRSMRIMDPSARKDLMSYCDPIWISDYTYGALAIRRREISGATRARIVEPFALRAGFRGFRTLLTSADGASWGHRLASDAAPEGEPETAEALDEQGVVVAKVTVWKTAHGHGDGASYDVPAPAAGWAALRIAGHASLRFAAPAKAIALTPY